MENNNILVLDKSRSRAEGCENCIRRTSCLGAEMAGFGSEHFDRRVINRKLVHLGQPVIGVGEACNGIYIVRSGAFKSYFIDENGELQVLGFHLPGEIFGAEGLVTGTYTHFVESLGTGSVCKLPLSLFYKKTNEGNNRNMTLLRILGQVISRDQQLIFILSKLNAQQKFAYFLFDLANRLQQCGFEHAEISLGMSRADIANYLGMAVETVSRLFTRMQESGLLDINRRRLRIHDLKQLRTIACEQPTRSMFVSSAG